MFLQPDEKLEDSIVKILAGKPGLSAGELHSTIIGRGSSYTLQAVYKELAKLLEAQVVTKVKFGYYLRLSWILTLLEFAQGTHETYSEFIHETVLPEDLGKKRSWVYRDLASCDSLWGHLMLSMLLNCQSKQMFIWNAYPWHALLRHKTRGNFRKAVEALEAKFYILLSKPTFLSELCIKEYPPFYSWSFSNELCNGFENASFFIAGDFVLTIEYPAKIGNRIKELFEKTTPQTSFEHSPLLEIFHTKGRVQLTIQRNPTKAKKMSREFFRVFSEDLNRRPSESGVM